MEKIIIHVENKEKAKMLLDLLAALDFVDSVQTEQVEKVGQDAPADFFALAGIWQDRDITQESIRKEIKRFDVAEHLGAPALAT
ncbi:MAG: hypothetical protein D3923_12510 [Candidatus Electrothrix sp. AR3]|nr:hypothetical protein [Candidatus Electrothrix sp. AR3]